MKIEIKNVKHSEFASHETHCFEATVYVDGKRAFIAHNEGFGGPNSYSPIGKGKPRDVYERVNEIDTILNQEQVDVYGDGKHFVKNSLEIAISDLLNRYLSLRDLKNKLRRHIMAVDSEGTVFQYKDDPKKTCKEAITKLEKESNVKVLNGLPDDELVAHLKIFLSP